MPTLRHYLLFMFFPATLWSVEQKDIPAVNRMPNLPKPYVLRDWKKVARDFDALAFDFDKQGQFLPLPWWDDGRVDHDLTGFALPAYIGDLRQSPKSNNYDAITCLGAVLGATLAGIDKSDQQGKNWVEMLKIYYSQKNGTHLYLNNPGAKTGQSFWYEVFPSILFFQIYDRYRQDPEMKEQANAIAARWYEGCRALGAGEGQVPNFDHTSLDLLTGQPFDHPKWREPDAAAGVAWLEYMGGVVTGDARYFEAARWALQFLEERKVNPFYEILMPYGAYISARMNAEQGTNFSTHKLINWVFDGDNPREWGIIQEKWGHVEVFGLQGSVHKGSEYAFAMNSFLSPAVMVPIVRYDAGYGRAMGKWVLNVAVNARYLYPDAWSPEQQTSWEWAAKYDPTFSIAYEGLRKQGMERLRPVESRSIKGEQVVRHKVAEKNERQGGERLKPDAQGEIERLWKVRVPEGQKQVFVMELKPKDGSVASLTAEVEVAPSPEGPWKPAFKYAPGDKNRKWLGLKKSGDLWIRMKAQTRKPLDIEQIYVESRLAISPHASGDPLFHGWGQTDLGLYGGSFVGTLAGLVEPTNVEGILQIDCRATETFAAPSYPTYLFYNPHAEAKEIRFSVGAQAVDLYDTVRQEVLARNQTGEAVISIPPDTARVLVLYPSLAKLEVKGRHLSANGVVIDYQATPAR